MSKGEIKPIVLQIVPRVAEDGLSFVVREKTTKRQKRYISGNRFTLPGEKVKVFRFGLIGYATIYPDEFCSVKAAKKAAKKLFGEFHEIEYWEPK